MLGSNYQLAPVNFSSFIISQYLSILFGLPKFRNNLGLCIKHETPPVVDCIFNSSYFCRVADRTVNDLPQPSVLLTLPRQSPPALPAYRRPVQCRWHQISFQSTLVLFDTSELIRADDVRVCDDTARTAQAPCVACEVNPLTRHGISVQLLFAASIRPVRQLLISLGVSYF